VSRGIAVVEEKFVCFWFCACLCFPCGFVLVGHCFVLFPRRSVSSGCDVSFVLASQMRDVLYIRGIWLGRRSSFSRDIPGYSVCSRKQFWDAFFRRCFFGFSRFPLLTDHVLLSDGSCICLSDEVCLGFICTIYAVGAGLSIGRPVRCAPAVTSHRSCQGRSSSPSRFGGTFRETEWEAWAAVGL
jgi:hypothetical protein